MFGTYEQSKVGLKYSKFPSCFISQVGINPSADIYERQASSQLTATNRSRLFTEEFSNHSSIKPGFEACDELFSLCR